MLDSSDPDFVRAALDDRLDRDRRGRVQQVRRHRRDRQPAARLTRRRSATPASTRRSGSSSSPTRARRSTSRPATAGYRVFLADPDGRRPLLRADRVRAGAERPRRRRHRRLLDEAEAIRPALEADDVDNPGPAARRPARGWPTWPASTSWCSPTTGAPYPGFGDWAEQLIAESTGKDGKGILPVVVERPGRPQLRPQHPRRGARRRSAPRVAALRRAPARLGLRRLGRRAARRAAAAVGVRHRRRRPAHRDQPVRPARRRERQAGRPRDARRRRRRARRRRSSTAPVEVYASEGWLPDGTDHRRATRSPRCWTSSTPSTGTSP